VTTRVKSKKAKCASEIPICIALSISDGTRSMHYATAYFTSAGSRKYRTIMTLIPYKNFADVIPYYSSFNNKYDGEKLGWYGFHYNGDWINKNRYRIGLLGDESMKCPNISIFDKPLINDCILNAPDITQVNCDHLLFPLKNYYADDIVYD
jgi:hypothetical protein